MLRSSWIRVVLCILPCVLAWGQAPKYKAVWEPVNFNADLMLYDVYFVSDDSGWAVGGATELAGGVILHTRDGGTSWAIQMGDPQSSDAAIQSLRFIDATHGWAVQDALREPRLLHTDDGETWTPVGSVPRHFRDYTFTSVRNGIMADGGAGLWSTGDGGNSWKQVAACEVQAEVQGLTKRIECDFLSLYFPTPATGYAVGSSSALTNGFALFKTRDGGATWQSSVVQTDPGNAENVFFIDENTGYVRIGYPDSGLLYRTADGGQTWNRTGASPGASIRFADPEVGWAFHYGKLSYTTSGGKMWTSRTFTFPARVNAFSIPSRHRAYVAGLHGMIYRYSVVPAGYTAKGMLDAPMMPGYDLPISAEVDKIRPQIAALKVKIDRAMKNPARADTASPARVFGNGFFQATAPGQNAAGGGFAQDTSAAGGFAQDTSASLPIGPAMQDCCATDIQNLQTSFTGLNQQFPRIATRYRGLNLLLGGMQSFSDLLAKLQGARASFTALKSAPSLNAAATALQQFSSQLDQMAQSAARTLQGVRQ